MAESETTGWRTLISVLNHKTKIELDQCPKEYMLMLRIKSHYCRWAPHNVSMLLINCSFRFSKD